MVTSIKSFRAVILFSLLAVLFLAGCGESSSAPDIQEGDIVFQQSLSSQSAAIQLATNSKYSHCGIILNKNGVPYVFEAIRKVSYTPLEEWIKRGEGGQYVVMRVKNKNDITEEKITAIKEKAKEFEGKDYDLLFEWSDEKMYCSELVWKLYAENGINLSPLRRLDSYHLENPVVADKIKERFGELIKGEQLVVAPSDLMDSPLLEVIPRK